MIEPSPVVCASCGITFVMDPRLHELRQRDGGYFWCPNGHPQAFVSPKQPEVEKLREALSVTERERAAWEAEAVRLLGELDAYRGVPRPSALERPGTLKRLVGFVNLALEERKKNR